MGYVAPHTVGSVHAKISDGKNRLERLYSYAKGVDDGTDVYTEKLVGVLNEFHDRVNHDVDRGLRRGPRITDPIDGVVPFDWTVQDQLGLRAQSSPPPVPAFRNIWFFSAPGSGAPWFVGPSFEVGEWCKTTLGLNHQPIGYPIGGYMGLMGGDPGLSYNEVIHEQYLSLKHLLDTNPHVQDALRRVRAGLDTDIEFWFSGYSQSADGMEDALVLLFGDGGPYESLRSRINGVIQFGNPSKKGTGIARKARPDWLYRLVHDITTRGDFYAEATDEIRPLFYAEIVTAETSLSFAGHILKIAIPVLTNLMGALFGVSVGGLLKLPIVEAAATDAAQRPHEEVDDALIDLLSVKGLLNNAIPLIGLLFALPGLQAHGEYHLPKPEFRGLTGIDVGRGIVANFRR